MTNVLQEDNEFDEVSSREEVYLREHCEELKKQFLTPIASLPEEQELNVVVTSYSDDEHREDRVSRYSFTVGEWKRQFLAGIELMEQSKRWGGPCINLGNDIIDLGYHDSYVLEPVTDETRRRDEAIARDERLVATLAERGFDTSIFRNPGFASRNRVTLAEIVRLGKAIEQVLTEEGMSFADVEVPPQGM